jgi:hypothetical protein
MARIPPQVHAFLLCDRVLQQANTHKWCAIGTLSAIYSPLFPAPISFGIFASLGDVASGTHPQVVVRDPHGQALVQVEAQPQYAPTDTRRMLSLELGMQLPPVVFAEAGRHRVELVVERQVIAQRDLEVVDDPAWKETPQAGDLGVRALVLCDLAFQHAGSSAWSLIGIFDSIHVPALPARYPSLVVFWSLAGFRGGEMVVTTIRDNEGEVVYAMRGQIPPLPGIALELAFPFPPIEFRRAGSHSIELHVGERLMSMRSFTVHVIPPPQRLLI